MFQIANPIETITRRARARSDLLVYWFECSGTDVHDGFATASG
jgi:hypothetical protein